MTGRASPGETVTWLWWSQPWPGPGSWGMERAEWLRSPGPDQPRDHWVSWADQECGLWSVECGLVAQSCASPPILTTHTETLSLHSPCTSQSIPFLGVNYKLARGSFSRRGRVTFSVTFIVTTWGSIGSLHSDKWHDPVDLNIVIMTLPLTIVILSSTVYLGHLLDPDTER